jgi:drug/metabolite transporter (DMT)-like permease
VTQSGFARAASSPAPPTDTQAAYDRAQAATRRRRIALFFLLLTPALWATNYIVGRRAAGVVEPHLLATMRWTVALAVMLPLAAPTLVRLWPQWRREWPDLFILGAIGVWICGAFVYIGAQTTSALNIGLIYALSPVLLALLSPRLFNEALGGIQALGVGLAIAGTLLILSRGSAQTVLTLDFTVGDLWILTAVMGWTTYSVLLRKRPTVLEPFARLAATTAAGLVVIAPFTLVEILIKGLPQPSMQVAGMVLALALLPGIGAYFCYAYMLRELGPARAGLAICLGPLYGALMGWAFLGELPAWFHAVGAALILPGIYLANRKSNHVRQDSDRQSR